MTSRQYVFHDPIMRLVLETDDQALDRFARVLTPEAMVSFVAEIEKAGDRFTDECLEIQKRYNDKFDEILATKVVRIDKHIKGA